MDGIVLSDLIARGSGMAARATGGPCVLFRPASALSPLRPSGALMQLPVRFVASARRAGSLPHPVHEAVLDGAYVRVGDVLVDAGGTNWIVAACETLLPVICVRAARSVSVSRGGTGGGDTGLSAYGGRGLAAMLLANWPASMVAAGTGLDRTGIPGDVAPGAWSVLLPLLPSGAWPRAGDVLTDDLGRSGTVVDAEPTANGWHLTVRQAVP